MVSQGLCNHVTCVLDVPLAVLPDSLNFGSDILRNIQLITSYRGRLEHNGLLSQSNGSQRLCNHVTCVLDAPLAVLPDYLKFGSDILRNITYHMLSRGDWRTMGC